MTKKQRNEVYKKALISLEEESSHHFSNSYSICRALEDHSDYYAGDSLVPFFPEAELFNPNINTNTGEYWLPKKDLQTRQIILDFCIEMTL